MSRLRLDIVYPIQYGRSYCIWHLHVFSYWGRTKDFPHLHSIRLVWSTASEFAVIYTSQMLCFLFCSTFVISYILAHCHDYMAFIYTYLCWSNERTHFQVYRKAFSNIAKLYGIFGAPSGKNWKRSFFSTAGPIELFENALQTGRIWKRRLFRSSVEETFWNRALGCHNNNVISIFLNKNSKMSAVACVLKFLGRSVDGKMMRFSRWKRHFPWFFRLIVEGALRTFMMENYTPLARAKMKCK